MSKIIKEKGIYKIFERKNLFLIGYSEELAGCKLPFTKENKDEIYSKALNKLEDMNIVHENVIVFQFNAPEVFQAADRYFALRNTIGSKDNAFELLSKTDQYMYLMHDFDSESLSNGLNFWDSFNECLSYEHLNLFISSIDELFGCDKKDELVEKMKDILLKAYQYKKTGKMSGSFDNLTSNYYKIRKNWFLKWYEEIKKIL